MSAARGVSAAWRGALRAIAVTIAIGAAFGCVASLDARALVAALGRADATWLLLPLPALIALSIDAWSWRRLMRTLGHDPALEDVLAGRLAAEALTLSLPGGAGVAESTIPSLLEARAGVPAADVFASSVSKRWAVMQAHAIYVFTGGALGFAFLAAQSRALVGRAGLEWLVLASAVLPLAMSFALRGALSGGVVDRARAALERVPWLARLMPAHAARSATRADASLIALARRADHAPVIAALGAWLCEALEAVLILRLLHGAPEIASVLAIEAGLSVVRSAAAFTPAGLGVQDLGYLRGLAAAGLGDLAGGFVVLKRAREVATVALGYVVLLALRRAAPRLQTA